jgi:PAS domain S-box-containing protein
MKEAVLKHVFLFFIAACATIGFIVSEVYAQSATENSLTKLSTESPSHNIQASVPESRKYRAAVLRDLPPLYVKQPVSEKPTGFAVELLDELSRQAGFAVELVVVESWEDAINLLKSGHVHFIPGIAVIEDLKKEFIYSTEIVSVPVSFFRCSGEADIKAVSDLSGKKVAVIPKSPAEEALADYPDIATVRMPNVETLLVSLLAGEVDAVLCPEYSMIKKASEIGVRNKIQVTGQSFFYLKRAYQFRQEDHLLRDRINEALQHYLQTEDYLRLYRKWYEPHEFWTPLHMTVLVAAIVGIIGLLTALFFRGRLIHTKKQLTQQSVHFQLLFETMTLGVIYQAADGCIISANPAAEKILGLSLEEMQGKTSMDPRWKMIREDGSDVPGEKHPAMIALRTGQKVGPVVRGVFHAGKNTHFWLSITAVPLFEPGKKTPFQAYAIFDDITERKQAEEALRESETFLTYVSNMAKVGGWKLDVATGKVHWTTETYRIHDIPEDKSYDVSGAVTFFDMPWRTTIEAAIQHCIETGESYDLELPFTSAKGRHLWTHTIGHALQQNGKTVEIIGTFQDITDRKQAEEEIRILNKELEQRVAQRTADLTAKTNELERINKVFVDRELRMRELKERIAELEGKEK